MKMKNMAAVALAVVALAAPTAARAGANGDIFEIMPVDENGAAVDVPTEPLDGGDVARFVVRLMKPDLPGNQFRLVHIGINSEAVDWMANRPAIGVYVNGVFTLAYLEKVVSRKTYYTDFIFSYTVKPGDFALPVRLADEHKNMVKDTSTVISDAPSGAYYLNFLDAVLGSPSWKVDDSTDSTAATREANFFYGNARGYPWPYDDITVRHLDFDLSGCNFNVQTVDFDAKDEDPSYWRSVYEHSTDAQPVSSTPSLVVSGMPTNSVTLYVWSENPEYVELIAGRDVSSVSTRPVHTNATSTASRQVGVIKVVAGKQEYEFNLRGVAATNDATIVLSAFPDFNYNEGTNARLNDYSVRTVRCIGPQPASVTIKPGKDLVTATSDYGTYVTELTVALSENPVDHDFEVIVTNSFSDAACPNAWWDYMRLSASASIDPTLTTPNGCPRLTFRKGDTLPSQLTIPTAAGDVTTAVIGGKLYLYALGSDEYVRGANKIRFAATTTDPTAILPSSAGGIDGWGTWQSSITIDAQNPVVVSMFDGTDFATAVAGEPRTLQIVVSDTYADMTCTNGGYQIWIERNTDTATTFDRVDGLYRPGKGGVLFLADTKDTLPAVVYSEPVTNNSVLYVVSPVSGNQSANHNFKVQVTTPAGYTVETTTGAEEFNEGDPVQVVITLDKQNTLGDIYAYIRGETDEAMEAIDATWKAADGGKGRKLAQYGWSITSGCKFTLLDGVEGGSDFSYEVVFLNQGTWTTNAEARVTAYQQKNTLPITVFNVVPSVKQVNVGASGVVTVNGGDVVVRGTTTPAKFPMGVTNDMSIAVIEPGLIDKTGTNEPFQVRWTFVDESGVVYYPCTNGVEISDGIVYGNPDTTPCQFDFPSEGRWTVTVDLKDKDMADFGNGTVGEMFTFFVTVIDQPTITVVADASYNEQNCVDFGGDAKIDVALQINNCTFDMWVNLLVEPNKTGGTGTFLLQESSDVVKQPDGSYNVRFPRRNTSQTVFVQTMDGTADSRTTGFKITPTMVEDDVHVVPNSGGKHPHEYYLGVVTPKILVINDSPLLDEEFDVYPVPGTNAIPAAIGAADEAITWAFDDVALDFSRGITVEFKGGGGWGPKTYYTREDALADGAIGFTPKFSASGPQSVKLIVKDSDGGTTTVIWSYVVEAAKSMTLVAHGPASGDVSKYDSAAGLGRGRVWADSKSAISASSFASMINCGLATSWRVYGYGYKVGDLDDGVNLHSPDGFGDYTLGYYTDRDTPLNESGANLGNGTPYEYAAPSDHNGNPVDSFLYTWMTLSANTEGGATSFEMLNSATAPEYVGVGRDSGKTVSLPTEQDDAGNYMDTSLEAIFSIEFLATDNMGDINLDGIPDVYVNKYGFSIVDPETGTSTGTDLTKLNAFNDDNDFLPAGDTSAYGTLIPGIAGTWVTVGRPFTAKLEIRGNGEALNDATENNPFTRVANMRPDRVYTDPRTDTLSTLDGFDGEMPVEYLAWLDFAAANGLDPDDKANWTQWSPERPTDPTVEDTDGDGFPDGYEYFLWYRAHVGYNDGGVHKYLTGRRYDPRNPGEGTFITAAQIAAAYDPVVANGAFSEDLDTDNDGLPDLVEFAIGTNPVDFDTDGDGLPDGFEIMVAGTDPLLAYTSKGICDAMRNFDGDAMAYTSPYYEEKLAIPTPKHIKSLTSFALVDANGDTDGVQWYVMPTTEIPTNLVYTDDAEGYLVKVGKVTYVTTVLPAFVTRAGVVRLAADLAPETTWKTGNFTADDGDKLVRLMPTRLVAGTVLDAAPNVSATTPFGFVTFGAKVVDSMTAWPYGRSVSTLTTGSNLANQGGFGFLTLGRYKDAPGGVPLAALPEEDKNIAYLHHFVYQEFGFDPRTAWNANTPLGARWGKTIEVDDANGDFTTSEAKLDNINATFGYAGSANRTREYTLYDEFLVMSFFLNSLAGEDRMNVHPTTTRPWYKIWSEYTTNGQGPNEPDLDTSDEHYRTRPTLADSPAENGADTDGDGVPDGWELYVMSGPKIVKKVEDVEKRYFRMPAPYDDGFLSSFGPFVAHAKNASYTDNSATDGNETSGGDGDGLTEWQEFAGTDTTLYYADFSTTITRPEEHAGWLNKFFPTDPWNGDTDGDGVGDSGEKGAFAYGTPADDGKLVTIPGGGLNPLSVDTDFDGLPDGWELQFKGKKVYSGEDATYVKVDGANAGNPLEGLVDGMDGTVPDAYNLAHGPGDGDNVYHSGTFKRSDGSTMFGKVNRDYDHDGLENWQEYMVGTMRCWRYDDPLTGWDSIPDELYWDENGNFRPDYELLGVETDVPDGGVGEFWYRTLVDKESDIYNPRLLSGQTTGAQYFSPVTNVWDLAYVDHTAGGAWYVFKDRIGADSLEDLWVKPFIEDSMKSLPKGFVSKPRRYISCSPIDYDTDHDGMDDYYELFHGMNPLLGASGVPLSRDEPCDVVFDAWWGEGASTLFEAWNTNDKKANKWTYLVSIGNYYKTGEPPRGTGYDFEYFPWLNGLATADPDGDDRRNQDEAIMPKIATDTWLHTDPTPLWMTDSEYDRSLTRLYFRMPGRDTMAPTPGDSFEYNGVTYDFVDFCGWAPMIPPFIPPRFVPCSQDLWWGLYGVGAMNWIASFEENEGYDSDHDAMSDSEECAGQLRAASDPQYADSPNRRQAMYFQGPSKPSALQTPPEVAERYPVAMIGYPDEPTFLKFTVECWAMPESLADATLVERAIWCDPSKAGDEELVRKNFQLGIRNRRWYAKFDSNGTLSRSAVELLGSDDIEVGTWHHIAATFDGERFVLYVDGDEATTPKASRTQPEYGSSALTLHRKVNANLVGGNVETIGDSGPGDYWSDAEYDLITLVVGASLRTQAEGGISDAFELAKAVGWDYYNRFFTGYIDEIRIWDGARTAAEIRSDFSTRKRYTRETALENRSAFYRDYTLYYNRYMKDSNGDDASLVPELIYHFSFDSVPGGADETAVAKVPLGFDYYQPAALGKTERGAAVLSRPLDWTAAWWSKVVAAYGSVYSSDQWVQWIPNTVAHLPRFDGTTLDSFFWSDNTCGGTNGTYRFALTGEPASRWTQLEYNEWVRSTYYAAPGMRHHLLGEMHNVGDGGSNAVENVAFRQYRFTGRHLLREGLDLLPLGGAFPKSCASLWDGSGASTAWEITSDDADANGLPDTWEEYAVANYSPASEPLTWTTIVNWRRPSDGAVFEITAGEAYRRDLAYGRIVAVNDDGYLDVVDRDDLVQTADEDHSGTPDWWDDLYSVYGEGGTTDSDNDGLSNFSEYLASECFPFGFLLNPKMPKTDAKTLDYFRRVGSLYLGEMFTDHDQMEDWWERSLASDSVDPAVWDAQRDGDEDGWTNLDEARYSGWCQSTLAQLISHAAGDTTVLDMPEPAIKITARYNGDRALAKAGGEEGGSSSPILRVLTYTDEAMMRPDAEFAVQPGTVVTKEFYMGGWEDRVIRGTLDPGYVAYGDVDVYFAQLPQDDMYSWIDESGELHVSRPYSEFKAALAKNPDIIQNVETFQWRHLEPASYNGATAEKAVTVTSGGNIAVYGERVGKIDLQTGDFEFDMSAMAKLSFKGFYSGSEANTWGVKEAIYKLVYTAKVPDTQYYKVTASLVQPERGFVKGGRNSIFAYWDIGGDGAYTPGEDPAGVVRDVDIGWCGCEVDLELSDTSAVTPRIKLWEDSTSDRIVRFGLSQPSNTTTATLPATKDVRVRVLRLTIDDDQAIDYQWEVPYDRVVLDRVFHGDVRDFIHEGDFLADGEFDIDWSTLWSDISAVPSVKCTNVAYAVVIGEGNISRDALHKDAEILAHPILVTRRFEAQRTAPTAVSVNGDSICRTARPTFRWKIENEDPWASAFGTTYTAFRIVVRSLDTGKEVYDSGYQRMPACDSTGVYNWTAPLYVDCPSPSGDHLVFSNLSNYYWRVYTYNAKYKSDNSGSSMPVFRMNVTSLDGSSYPIDVDVCYAGPAARLANRIRVQAFESPDFTGYPASEAIVTNVARTALDGSAGSRVRLPGLRAGTYFLRAFIDTDYDWALGDWESWGYLSERDTAAVVGTKKIFNLVPVTVGPDMETPAVRKLFIEDRDTDGDGFPDVWEAEQNGNVFDPEEIGPVTGDAELIAVNPNLSATLSKADQGYVAAAVSALSGANGLAMMTGLPVSSARFALLGGALPAAIVEDTVSITSLAIDRESGEVVLGVGADTEAAVGDSAVAALYSLSVSRGAVAKVKVYRTDTLAGEWKLVAEETVTIDSAGAEIRAPLSPELDLSSGFFKVEIEQ